ncbi:MAG: methyltransferase domain-containing protein [Betaproteobacteria bacterium]
MNNQDHVLAFYSRHPISHEQILAGAKSRRGHLDALTPEDLFPFDQDHYGGLSVVDALAQRARIVTGSHVADFCAGLAGPARYLAHKYGAILTCVELNPNRAPGAADLTRRVGLAQRVRVVRGDVMRVPLASGCMDAVISQEALLHVPDKRAALTEAYRVLRPGGMLSFTDWAEHQPLAAADAESMWRGIAAQSVQSFSGYEEMLQGIGFRDVASEDLTSEWGDILEERFRMYRALREETVKIGTPSGDEDFYRSYARLVTLVQSRTLGGGRFTARK